MEMSERELERSIEAILMVVEEPLSEVVLAQIIERPTEEILEALHRLAGSMSPRLAALNSNRFQGVGAFIATTILRL